ncbi:DUF221-domain-containing protein [Piromyces finnis]|uniref:DUF221-domain-containing protein n=1 Tax=Piromyces finnis TaxID=1754191 RepID=A0A1Y1VLH3_9FUNG|nr:DUF221-domain-containing protein [Piromyces finnis]|eukprot:ORX59308.1 DUF221-domain-containing protein [Piromyces finnis]
MAEDTEQDGTLNSVLYQLLLAFAIVGAFMIGYELLRQSKIGKYIYAPRLLLLPENTPEVANGWFAWFSKNKKVDEDYILNNNGLDAVMVLKLYRMGYQMFLIIGLVVLIFTLPVNIFFRDRDRKIADQKEDLLFDYTSPANNTENREVLVTNTTVIDRVNPSVNISKIEETKALLDTFKRDLQEDVFQLDISIEEERNKFFDEEIKILNEIKNGKHQTDNNSNNNENSNENVNASDNTPNENSNNNNGENKDENGNASINDQNKEETKDREINVFDDLTKKTNDTLNTIKDELNFDIREYIFFDTLKEGKELFSLLHLVCVYFVVCFICYKLFKVYQEYIGCVEKYVKDGGIVQERQLFGEILQHSTIMVRNIPPELQDDERLMNWFSKLGVGKIESVVIARSRNKIRRLVEARTKVLNALEDDYVNWLNNIKDKKTGEGFLGNALKNVVRNDADDIGEKVFEDNDAYRPKEIVFKYGIIPVRYVDSIQYHERMLSELTEQIKELRLEAGQSKKWSQTAFITFNNHQSAKIAAQLILYSAKNPNVMLASSAPHPNDLLYKNLNIRTERKTYRFILSLIALYFVCFLLTIVVMATKYEMLKDILTSEKLKYLQMEKIFNAIDNDPKLMALFSSFFQVILLNAYLSCVPYLIKFITNFQGFETKSDYYNSVLKKYYIFLVILIIFSLSLSALVSKIVDSTNSEKMNMNEVGEMSTNIMGRFMDELTFTHFVDSLTSELSKNSIIYFNYGILRLQSFGFEIFRIGAVVSFFISKILKKSSPRAQHLANQMATPPDYSIMLAVPLICFTLFVTFSIVNPFIPFIGVIFFFIGYHVMKNQFIYVYIKEFEAQGYFFVTCFNRIIFSLYLFEIFMFGYFLAVFNGPETKGKYIPYLVLPTIFITIYFQRYCSRCFKPRIKNVPVDLLISKERKEKYSNEYQRRTIFGRRESFISDYFSEDSFTSCATHITSLDSKPNKEILKMAETQAPSLPPYYEANSYNNPALTEPLYAPWIPEEAQSIFTKASVNHISNICRDCYKCDKESKFE